MISMNEAKQARENAHKTAIKRGKASAPFKRILSKGFIPKGTRVLDYGCGRGDDVKHLRGCEGYDPHWRKSLPIGKFDVVTCTYVLNVLSEGDSMLVLRAIDEKLHDDGVAYITVRRDLDSLNGFTKRGTYQRLVELPFEIAIKETRYITYRMRKGDYIDLFKQ